MQLSGRYEGGGGKTKRCPPDEINTSWGCRRSSKVMKSAPVTSLDPSQLNTSVFPQPANQLQGSRTVAALRCWRPKAGQHLVGSAQPESTAGLNTDAGAESITVVISVQVSWIWFQRLVNGECVCITVTRLGPKLTHSHRNSQEMVLFRKITAVSNLFIFFLFSIFSTAKVSLSSHVHVICRNMYMMNGCWLNNKEPKAKKKSNTHTHKPTCKHNLNGWAQMTGYSSEVNPRCLFLLPWRGCVQSGGTTGESPVPGRNNRKK